MIYYCRSLSSVVGHARDIDIVLAKSLSEAKHYLAKTACERDVPTA